MCLQEEDKKNEGSTAEVGGDFRRRRTLPPLGEEDGEGGAQQGRKRSGNNETGFGRRDNTIPSDDENGVFFRLFFSFSVELYGLI